MVALMTNPIVPESAAAAPITTKDPRDRYSVYTIFWVVWGLAFGAVEAVALWADNHHRDRVKRTLSSNLRAWFAWDSITGRPVDARFGRARRAAFVMGVAWFGEHIRRNGGTRELKL